MKKKLVVGVSSFSPLVIKTKDGYAGFEIELWEKIAKALSLDFSYKEFLFKDLLEEIKKKKVDIGIAGISRTNERGKIYRFFTFYTYVGFTDSHFKEVKA